MDGYVTCMCKRLALCTGVCAIAVGCIWPGWSADEDTAAYGIGRPATDENIRAWDIDVSPSGDGLPPGQGTVQEGARVFATKCAACHGPTGTEGPKDRLVGGRNTLATSKPIKTIGSYWPYATTLYDYINRAMPFDAPQSLTPDETYSLVAWLLHQNGIVGDDAVMNARTLPSVEMPNKHGFLRDPKAEMPAP